jgi:hypothetical protein
VDLEPVATAIRALGQHQILSIEVVVTLERNG